MEELSLLSPQQLDEREARHTANLKRLMAKKFHADERLEQLETQLTFLRAHLEPASPLVANTFYHDQVQGLMTRLEEAEARNIELESQCLLAPRREKGSMVDDIVNEFGQMIVFEKEKNKKLGLYVKKGFVSSQEEDIDKLRKETELLNKNIQAELALVAELEERELETLQNLSLLERMSGQ